MVLSMHKTAQTRTSQLRGAENKGQDLQRPQQIQVFSRAKETQKEILKAMGRMQRKTEQMEIVLNGPRNASVCRMSPYTKLR